MKFNIGSKVDPARKIAISTLQIRNVFISSMICLILVGIGLIPFISALSAKYEPVSATVLSKTLDTESQNYTVEFEYVVSGKTYVNSINMGKSHADGLSVGSKRNIYYKVSDVNKLSESSFDYIGLIVGIALFLVGGLLLMSAIISCTRWFRKEKLEQKARRAVGSAGAESDPILLTEYSFASGYDERLNQLMQDNTKKIGIVSNFGMKTFSLKTSDGTAAIEASTKHMLSVFTSQYQIKNNQTAVESIHKARRAFFKPVGLVVNLGKFGSFVSPLGAVHTTDFVLDGKLFWDEFYRSGYYFDRTYNGVRSVYSIKKCGTEIAEVTAKALNETANVGVKFLKDMPSVGQYTVKCRDCDLETIFMFCIFLYFCDHSNNS